MSIDLRSSWGLHDAARALLRGDYNSESSIKIRLHQGFFSKPLDPNDLNNLCRLMRAIGSISSLETLKIEPSAFSFTSDEWSCCLPVEALTSAMNEARSLSSLTVEMEVVLVGRAESFKGLALSLKDHQHLKHVDFECRAREGVDITTRHDFSDTETGALSLLDPVVFALGHVQGLQTIQFCDSRRPRGKALAHLSNESLRKICSIPNIQDLRLYSFEINDAHLTIMASQLRGKQKLIILGISCSDLGKRGTKAWKEMIATNRKIEKLHVVVKSLKEGGAKGALLIGQLVQQLGPAKNCSALRLTVPESIAKRTLLSVRQLVQSNYTLRTIGLHRYDGRCTWWVTDDEIDFLLKTNRLGRGKLFKQTNEGEVDDSTLWMTLFEATEGKLDSIYTLVRSHPSDFSQMLLKDHSENMPPSTKVLRSLLRDHQKTTTKKLDRVERAVVEDVAEKLDRVERAVYVLIGCVFVGTLSLVLLFVAYVFFVKNSRN
ncbi:expressed unknown protein [Seminavis robusta]|uniref:Uncharacterized protein n=1 Tax=Seminavis robusta TaxID=568900 RepID=A0A9N8E1M0_9STRA|nr:expressed unknown protein [Seminavis robusta]|eukprot:Sro556_g165990.1 n/a (489) ;mRNA; f:43469-44935